MQKKPRDSFHELEPRPLGIGDRVFVRIPTSHGLIEQSAVVEAIQISLKRALVRVDTTKKISSVMIADCRVYRKFGETEVTG